MQSSNCVPHTFHQSHPLHFVCPLLIPRLPIHCKVETTLDLGQMILIWLKTSLLALAFEKLWREAFHLESYIA